MEHKSQQLRFKAASVPAWDTPLTGKERLNALLLVTAVVEVVAPVVAVVCGVCVWCAGVVWS